MGNHEYCTDCGESDFHYLRPCDPVKLAARRKEQAEADARKITQIDRMRKTLDLLGVEYRVDEYGNATISHSQFSDTQIAWRKERLEVVTPCGKEWWAESGWDDISEDTCVREKGHDGDCKSQSGSNLSKFYKERISV